MKIFIVEADTHLSSILGYYLKQLGPGLGLDIEVKNYQLCKVCDQVPDLIILDVDSTGKIGSESQLNHFLRDHHQIKVLLLHQGKMKMSNPEFSNTKVLDVFRKDEYLFENLKNLIGQFHKQ